MFMVTKARVPITKDCGNWPTTVFLSEKVLMLEIRFRQNKFRRPLD